MNSLLKKVEAIEASTAKGKNDTAKNQLNALANEINAQKGKQIDVVRNWDGSIYLTKREIKGQVYTGCCPNQTYVSPVPHEPYKFNDYKKIL